MITSDKKRSANQRNGRLSTGPKTAAGKRAPSINAMRHGLSVKNDLNGIGPRYKKLQETLKDELNDEHHAGIIASRILDYERTEAYMLEVALLEWAGNDGFIEAAALQMSQRDVGVQMSLVGCLEKELEQKMDKQKKKEIKVYRDALKFLARISLVKCQKIMSDGQKESIRLRRYFKRASNQLIKSVKAAQT